MVESASQAEELRGRSAVSQLLLHLRYLAGVLFSASQNRLNIIGGMSTIPLSSATISRRSRRDVQRRRHLSPDAVVFVVRLKEENVSALRPRG
jgi:hypothetical protein